MNVTDRPLSDTMPDEDRLSALTLKQRDVLDLLVQYKTSKEISRILAISPHTVDQRVDAAKGKLGAGSRAELALIYRDLVGDDGSAPYERLTYDPSHMAAAQVSLHAVAEPEATTPIAELMFGTMAASAPVGNERDFRVGPELLDGRWGTLARLVTILAIAILLCVGFLGGLAIMMELSSLIGR